MDPVIWIVSKIDPFLIAPYRWFDNPMASWWLGTFILALWAGIIGELSLAAAYRLNRSQVAENDEQTLYYHRQSMAAKKAGDETAYRGINNLANEAFGKGFFLLAAMGMASLWPAFFAAAWLNLRFGELTFSLPRWAGGLELNFIAPFIVLYILARVVISKVKRLALTRTTSDAVPPTDSGPVYRKG
jgi:hypothetical protein